MKTDTKPATQEALAQWNARQYEWLKCKAQAERISLVCAALRFGAEYRKMIEKQHKIR